MPFLLVVYSYPERLALLPDENGRPLMSRVPGHPTRPARPWESAAGWWEDLPRDRVADALSAGHTVRLGREDSTRLACPGPMACATAAGQAAPGVRGRGARR